MAFIDCPECDDKVNSNAKRCPNCGEKLKSPLKDAAIIIGGAIVAGTLINLGHKLIENSEKE